MISRAAIEKREVIAKAICKSRSCEGINCCQWPAQGGRLNCPVKNGGYDSAADAVLSALAAEGMVLVPVEASDELYKAVCNNGFVGDRSCFDSDYALIISAAGASDADK